MKDLHINPRKDHVLVDRYSRYEDDLSRIHVRFAYYICQCEALLL